MGIYPRNREVKYVYRDPPNVNPDPTNFEVLKIEQFENAVLLWVNYPNCTNYEGNKIMAFQGNDLKRFIGLKSLDPHFQKDTLSPIARFEPTDRGWLWGENFCTNFL